jgi:hypothetical protein
MTSAKQWGRVALLTISDTATGTTFDVSELRLRFNVTTRITFVEPDCAEIRIYNLAPDTVHRLLSMPIVPPGNVISTTGANTTSQPAAIATGVPSKTVTPVDNKSPGRVRLEAGYQGNFGTIFEGQLVQVRVGRESPMDTYVDIFAADGDAAHKWGFLNATLSEGYTAQDVVDQCMAGFAPLGVNGGGKFPTDTGVDQRQAPRGKVMFGHTRNILHDLCRTYRASWYLNADQLKFLPLSAYAPGEAVKVDVLSGMIGLPRQTNFGVSVTTLLNPGIGRGTQIKIDNASVQRLSFSGTAVDGDAIYQNTILANNLDADGVYKAFMVRHYGDTRGNEWYSEAECVSVDPTNIGRLNVPDQALLTI